MRAARENWSTLAADVIMYWGFPPLDLAWANVPVIHAAHASALDRANRQDSDWMRRLADSNADYFVGVSESAAASFSKDIRQRHPVAVIHNGSETERVTPKMGRAQQRKMWKIPEDM